MLLLQGAFEKLVCEEDRPSHPETNDAAKLFDLILGVEASYSEKGLPEDVASRLLLDACSFRFLAGSKVVFLPSYVILEADYEASLKLKPPFYGNENDWLHFAMSLETLIGAIDELADDSKLYVMLLQGPKGNVSVAAYPVPFGRKKVLSYLSVHGDSDSTFKKPSRPYPTSKYPKLPNPMLVCEVDGEKLGWCNNYSAIRKKCLLSPHVCLHYALAAFALLLRKSDVEVHRHGKSLQSGAPALGRQAIGTSFAQQC